MQGQHLLWWCCLCLCWWCGSVLAWTSSSSPLLHLHHATTTSRHISKSISHHYVKSLSSSRSHRLEMSSSPNIFADVANKFSLQICLGPSLKDIKITDDDPTAGMSQDQFNSYMNSGVNLCGWPEWLNIGLGFALNSGLLLLGFQFLVLIITEIGVLVKENEAKEVLKDVDRRASTSKQRSWVGQLAEANNLWTRASLDQKSLFNFTPPNSPSTPPSFPSSTSPGLNREERRLRAKFERERENKTK